MNTTRKLNMEPEHERIPLLGGHFALVDKEDYERLSQFQWYIRKAKNTAYAIRNRQAWEGKAGETIIMHREILPTPGPVDHINRSGLDNRRANLRPATNSQNSQNIGRRSDNTSGFKGVGIYKPKGNWRARISPEPGKRITIGYFSTPVEAAIAYDVAAIKYHGEFAVLNFPEGAPK